MNKLKLTFTLIALLVIGGVVAVFFYQTSVVNGIIRKADYSKSAIKVSQKIEQVWREGDRKRLISRKIISCPKLGDLSSAGDSYLMCNPKFVACFIKEKKNLFSGTILGQKKQIVFKKFITSKDIYQIENRESLSHPLTLNKQVRLTFSFNGDNENYSILLEDSCSDVYLPQRIFGYSKSTDTKRFMDWRWDNFGQSIYIDKFLVSNLKINDWIERYNLKIKKNNDLSMPSTELTLKQMKTYCQSEGKQVLSTQIYDAASIHPGNITNNKPNRNLKYIYPWSRLKRKSFLFKKRQNNNYVLTKSNCLKAHTLDCNDVLDYRNYETRSVSWAGIYQLLGGPLEAMTNEFEKDYNLKASSFYSLSSSKLHELGKRLQWDGIGNSFKNIKGLNPNINGNDNKIFKIGFRCMRKVENE